MTVQPPPKGWQPSGIAAGVLAGCLWVSSALIYAQPPDEIGKPGEIGKPAEVQVPGEAEVQGPGEVAAPIVRTPRSERTLEYWGGQLSHERFLRRQSAQRHLVSGGQASVPVLTKMLDEGDLETIESVISILSKISETEKPWREDGAVATLESLAKSSFGTKATLAKSTLKSFAETRGQEARIHLKEAGIFVGPETVALGSRSSLREILRIDQEWDGDLESLAWLRWLGDVSFVVVVGSAVKPEVFESVVKIPNLATLVLIDCELTTASIKILQRPARIDSMELRYVRLNDELLVEIADIRLRNSLFLMGTGVSEERVERMRVDMPGLEITRRRGGFLGVICRSTLQNYCEVSEVMPDSGAAEAGLQSGDIIVRIDDVKITQFEDLQRQINTHIPGDQIAVRFRRNGELLDASATLKKLSTQ